MFLYERRFYLHNMYIWDDMDDLDLDMMIWIQIIMMIWDEVLILFLADELA